jgi:hypothetical protein
MRYFHDRFLRAPAAGNFLSRRSIGSVDRALAKAIQISFSLPSNTGYQQKFSQSM